MSLINNYLKLVTSEHRDKPKYTEMLTSLLQYSEDVFTLAVGVDDEFDVDLAIGAQEDILGVIVGSKRTLDFIPSKGLSSFLDNSVYRTLLRAKIAQNMWKGGILDLRDLWVTLFETSIVIRDNQDMTIDVTIINNMLDQLTKELIVNGLIVPKPQSVQMNILFADEAVFGYDMETNVIRGYDHARWANNSSADDIFAYDRDDANEKMHGYDKGNWL